MTRLAAVLVAAALVLTGCGGGSSSHAPGARAATRPMAFACPDPHAKIRPTPGDSLPEGARAALICYSAAMPVAWQAPADALTEGVDRLVSFVNRRHRSPHSDACNLDAGPAYRIVLDYPGGARLINGETAGCRDVRVGDTDRLGGRTVWHTFLALLARQRAHSTPRRLPAASRPTCTTQHHQLPFTPLWDARVLRRVRLCVLADDGPGVALNPRDVRLLRHDLLTMAPRSQRRPIRPRACAPSVRRGYDVVAVDGWGDRVDIRGYCDIYLAVFPETAVSGYVRELPATARMFERLTTAAIG